MASDEAKSLGDALVAHIDALFDPADEDGREAKQQLLNAAMKFKAVQKQEIQARDDPKAGYLVAKELDAYCHSEQLDLGLYSEEHITQLTSRDPCTQAESFGQKASAKQDEVEVSRLETIEFMTDRKRLADEQQLPRAVELFREEQEILAADCRKRNELCALATDPEVDTDDREVLRRTGELKQVFLRTGDIDSLRQILDEVEVISSDVVINDVSLSFGMHLSAAQALLPGHTDFPVRKIHVLSKEIVIDETLLSNGMELLRSKEVLAVGDGSAPRTFDLVTDQFPEGAWVVATFRQWYDSTQLHQPSVDAEFEALGLQVSENRRSGVEYLACKTSESLAGFEGKVSAVREKASCLQERRKEFAKETRNVEAEVRRLQEELGGIDATDESILADVKKLTQQCDDQMTDAHIEVLQASSRAQQLLTEYLAAFEVFVSRRASHQRLCCLHNRLQKRSEELEDQRQKLGQCIETARKNCEMLLCSSLKADKEVGETETQFVAGILADAESVGDTQRQSIQLCDGLLCRSITERDDDIMELVRLRQKVEADIDQEKAQGKRVAVLRKMQGELKGLHRRAKAKKEQLNLVRSIRTRMEEHMGTISSADSHDPWDVVPLLDELFPMVAKSAPVVETAIATMKPMDIADLVQQEVQKALREKEKETEKAYADGYKAAMQQQSAAGNTEKKEKKEEKK